jgi:hypothetical protein
MELSFTTGGFHYGWRPTARKFEIAHHGNFKYVFKLANHGELEAARLRGCAWTDGYFRACKLPNAYARYKVEKKRRVCISPEKRTKIDPCLQYPHVESTTVMTENIESEKHWCDVD